MLIFALESYLKERGILKKKLERGYEKSQEQEVTIGVVWICGPNLNLAHFTVLFKVYPWVTFFINIQDWLTSLR